MKRNIQKELRKLKIIRKENRKKIILDKCATNIICSDVKYVSSFNYFKLMANSLFHLINKNRQQ